MACSTCIHILISPDTNPSSIHCNWHNPKQTVAQRGPPTYPNQQLPHLLNDPLKSSVKVLHVVLIRLAPPSSQPRPSNSQVQKQEHRTIHIYYSNLKGEPIIHL